MDPKTKNYYSTRVKETFDLYKTVKTEGIGKYFPTTFPKGSRVLDMGAGSGRDLLKLLDAGYDSYGIDASEEMVNRAIVEKTRLNNRLMAASIPAEKPFFEQPFDGILCTAVMMHIPDEHLFDAAYSIRANLKEKGRLLFSVPLSRDDLDGEGRCPDGRLFKIRPPEYYDLLFERIGFRKLSYSEDEDALGREGIKWSVTVYELLSSTGTRSIDKIESVLNRDKKTATYKLALFRALADIAAREYNSVTWYPGGKVGVPMRTIAEKWLLYYWPVFESSDFVPQINGESPECSKPVKFRHSVTGLINQYKSSGGLDRFYLDYTYGNLDKEKEKHVNDIISEIAYTIRAGPVKYSGGSLDEGRVFDFNKNDKTVVMDASLWKELCLMWHWISDALLLRWGELTSRMSSYEINTSEVIDLLLKGPSEERETLISRNIFSELETIECVWTGKPVDAGFHVDHLIPYALWHNNELWNLLPAHPKVNAKKRDKLPEKSLLNRRKDIIIHYWNIVRGKAPVKFINDSIRFTGKKLNGNWENLLFSALVEAVEITAIQRGVERWGG